MRQSETTTTTAAATTPSCHEVQLPQNLSQDEANRDSATNDIAQSQSKNECATSKTSVQSSSQPQPEPKQS